MVDSVRTMFEEFAPCAELMARAFVLAADHGLSTYDATYVALAEARRAALELLGIHKQQWLFRMAQHAASVRRIVQPRLSLRARAAFRALIVGRDSGDLRRDVTLRRDALRCGPHEA